MSQDLSIIIKASLQNTDNQIKDLNSQISKIANNPKLDRLNLKININDNDIKKLSDQVDQIQKQIAAKSKGITIINEEEIRKGKKVYHQTIDEAIKRYEKLGAIKVDQNIDHATNKLKNFTIEIQRASGLVQKLKFNSINIQDGNKINQAFLLDDVKSIDQRAKLREQALQKEQQMQKSVHQEIVKNQQRENELREKVVQEEHKTRRAIEQTIEKEKEKARALEHQLELYKKQAELNARNAVRTYGSRIDENELNRYLNNVRGLQLDPSNMNNTRRQMRNLSMDFRQVEANARNATSSINAANRSSMSFAQMFSTAMVKFPIWLAASTAIFGTKAALESALTVIIDVDTAMTNLKKVMDQETNFDQMLANAVVQAKELGQTIVSVLDAYQEFARQGYNQGDINYLAEASLIAGNVGEIQAGQAAEYLTSALTQMKIEAKDSMSVIDSWNSISNQNATTVEKLAQGWARAASTAKVFGLDMHELNAAIGM